MASIIALMTIMVAYLIYQAIETVCEYKLEVEKERLDKEEHFYEIVEANKDRLVVRRIKYKED